MRKLEIKHPEYGKFGQLEKYGERYLTQEPEIGKRVDFTINVIPSVPYGQTKPEDADELKVTNKSLEILGKIFVDGVQLTDLYNWKMSVSSFNPHGYGVPKWKYQMIGTRKSPVIDKETLKEMVTEAVLSVMNKKV